MSARASSHETLLDLVTRSLDEQPLALGTVARVVIRLTADPAISITRLTRAISADPGLSVTIIRKANCAFYASRSVVTSLPSAIVKIGITATRSVAIAGSIYAMFRQGDPGGLEPYLWRHSLAVGVGARTIAHHAGFSLAEEAFLTGLVHDFAKLILLQRFPDIYKPILERTLRQDSAQIDIESTTMEFTHADLGAMILERWAFDPATIRAVRFHHDPDRAGAGSDDDGVRRDASQLAYAVCLANALAKHLERASHSPCEMDLPESLTRRYFRFTVEELNQIAEEVSSRMGDELQVFAQPDTPLFVSRHHYS